MRYCMAFLTAAALVGLMLIASGCEPADLAPGVEPAVVEAPLNGSAVITGKVSFSGRPPEMSEIANVPCHSAAEPLKEETVIVNENRTLRNTFVFLSGIRAGDGASRPPALLDQVNCQYVPHVVGVQIGQALRVRSSDPTLHNVQYNPRRNRPQNFGMTQAGAERTVSFQAPEFIRAKCDVHPWMTAYIGVFEHPWFAITGEDGSFELTGLPAGQYTLATWHEQYGSREQQITIVEGAKVEASFIYQAP
jgi:hypothetical protein